MTGDEHLEIPAGLINGSNTTFFTSVAYQSGTIRGYHNGQLIRGDNDDGIIEVNPLTGEFQTRIPYPNNDTLDVRYLEG
jgi:hypothetical protein